MLAIVAASLPLGSFWIASYLVLMCVPGAIGFGVLGARLRASPSARARSLACAGGCLGALALFVFLVAASRYNDDQPISAGIEGGLLAGTLVGLPALGLFLAGVVGASLRGRSRDRRERLADRGR